MQRAASAKTVQLIAFSILLSLGVILVFIFALSSRSGGFHGYYPAMSREAVVSLRTALAGLSMFVFFPLIWTMHHRSDEKDLSRLVYWSVLALALAESPAVFGLILFLVKGAFKTFFFFCGERLLHDDCLAALRRPIRVQQGGAARGMDKGIPVHS